MNQQRVVIIGPRTLAGSGLLLYVDALVEALVRYGHLAVERLAWSDEVVDLSTRNVVFWCGFPHLPHDALAIVMRMLAMPPNATQIVLPEWEGHSVEDLRQLLHPLRDKRLLIAGVNNAEVATDVVRDSDRWSTSYVPTPLVAKTTASVGDRDRDGVGPLRAMYLGRVTPVKRVGFLSATWSIPAVSNACTLDIYTSDIAEAGSLGGNWVVTGRSTGIQLLTKDLLGIKLITSM